MKGFETSALDHQSLSTAPEESRPAMKGFETPLDVLGVEVVLATEESRPAMKGFETCRDKRNTPASQLQRNPAPL